MLRELSESQKFVMEDRLGLFVLFETISTIMLFVANYILIHVFWHYGLNTEKTLEKQEKELQKKKQKLA